MLSSRFVASVAAALFLVGSGTAAFTATGKTNVAMYYGQGPYEGELGLAHFCQAANSPDIIPLGFINAYVAQGNGFPGSNFGSSCGSAVYPGPGYNGAKNTAHNILLSNCETLRESISVCQGLGKKILLSLGGASNTYRLTSNADATATADFLWGAFGPGSKTWNNPRPFDYLGKYTVIDGFDFDIEHTVAGEQQYYITLINRLQANIATWKKANPTGKTFLFTASPECAVKDANMGDIILGAKFDMIFIQFYNDMACSARTWANANPNYATTKREINSGFSYDQWVSAITASGSKSSAAKLYIGLPGNNSAATEASYYLYGTIKPLIEAYWCHPNFGGVMIWEAIYAEYNHDGNFYQYAKSILNGFASGTSSINCATVTTSKLSPTPTCGAGSCATTYTVKSGDICSQIASSHGLTMAQFTALNPKWTASTCPSLQIGTVLCVKAGAACKRSAGRELPLKNPETEFVADNKLAAEVEAPLVTPVPTLPRRHVHAHAHAHAHHHES